MGMVSQGSDAAATHPKVGVVAHSQEATPRASSRWKWFLCATAVVAVVVAVQYFHVQDVLQATLDWIGTLGPLGPVIFVGLYVVATVFFMPGSVLTLGAGAVFGVALGAVCVSIGATLGATAAFLVGRYLARDVIAWRLGLAEGEPQYDALEKRLAAAPGITVPTMTLEGDANGAPHPDGRVYATKFSGIYAHGSSRVASGIICRKKRRGPLPKRFSTLMGIDRRERTIPTPARGAAAPCVTNRSSYDDKMQAAQISKPGGEWEVVERDIPEPDAGHVRVKVEACGMCHSDVFVKEGLWPGLVYPRVPGHEIAGHIDAVGDNVSAWRPGQRVGVGWHGGHCFVCAPCRRGDFAM